MTTNPEHGMEAIGELENGRYNRLLERVVSILEMKLVWYESNLEPVGPSRIGLWLNHASTSPWPDYKLTPSAAHYFLYGLAVGIQGDWTP